MFSRKPNKTGRGSIFLLVLIAIPALLGIAAMAFDEGYKRVLQTQLQTALDAAALAAAREMGSIYYAMGLAADLDSNQVSDVQQVAMGVASENTVAGQGLILSNDDVELTHWNFDENYPVNAVRVSSAFPNARTLLSSLLGSRWPQQYSIDAELHSMAALTPASEFTPGLPFAIGADWFEGNDCGDAISWGGGGCAAWTTFSPQNVNANDLQEIMECLMDFPPQECMPSTALDGRELEFTNGGIAAALSDLEELFEAMRVRNDDIRDFDDDPDTWTVDVLIADFDCSTPNQLSQVVGYTTVTIEGVTTIGGGSLDATVDCEIKTQPNDHGGGGFGTVLGDLPRLVTE
ncbi:hypothetical protein F2Q65_11435 [Thiohalocapsa marina]|uniref:Putative Flp pilus-assembly TadG-like N-terminal domain-containing protein n=1 Tax=Thiohalocapsa marina TaxID=424902 RepID=A0A5M8FLW3_9GAMM|nr:pilus assembly protein TadG-related protein [Thiohalocapsa marina]KAA6184706.1 hypothetical protein F2Q65_11435 [Thiohalocapsa marina]